jgi:mono/diheme cytochrome c family protein
MKIFNRAAGYSLLFSALCSVTAGVYAADTDASKGREVFNEWCSGCHAPATKGGPLLAGTWALEMRYKNAKPAALEERTDLSAIQITAVVRHGQSSMPFFRKTEINDAQLRALGIYLAKGSGK